MELLSLTCGHCGAPLEVPEETRYVTCGYCSSKLEVHRSGGAIYTEVLEALQKGPRKSPTTSKSSNCKTNSNASIESGKANAKAA